MNLLRSPQDDAQITVCVPVYNGAAVVAQTLYDIQSQSFSNIRVLISVDQCEDESAEICQTFAQDARFTIVQQPQRLGWVGNTNFLLDQVRSPYVCVIPHDDRISPDYLQRLYDHLLQYPAAAAVYCDIQCFGIQNHIIIQESLAGERLDRVLRFLSAQFNSVVYRGLVRCSVVQDALRLIDNPYRGFAADSTWLLQLACRGTLHRLPETLYYKRIAQTTEHQHWKSWEQERAIAAWIQHCIDCTKVVLQENFLPEEHHLLLFACLNRTLQMTRQLWPFVEVYDLPPDEQNWLVSLWAASVLGIENPVANPLAGWVRAVPTPPSQTI
jgi:GT2 family glycosyltransferase